MNNTIRIRRIVETKIPLLRKPTFEELQMIERDEMFDIEATDLFDFNKEETIDEDYSYSNIKVVYDGKTMLNRVGGIVSLRV